MYSFSCSFVNILIDDLYFFATRLRRNSSARRLFGNRTTIETNTAVKLNVAAIWRET